MDVVATVGPFLVVSLFVLCSLIWFQFARKEENAEIRLKKMVGIFIVWFVLNFLYLLSQLMAPVWYEPSPVIPGLIALQTHLPFFVFFSIPFIIDFLNQSRRRSDS